MSGWKYKEKDIKEFIKIICEDWIKWGGGDFSKQIKKRAGEKFK